MEDKAIDRPFDKKLFKKASRLAQNYHMDFEKNVELGFIGNCVEMPTTYFDGKTQEKCKKAGREAIAVTIAVLLEMGRDLPSVQ